MGRSAGGAVAARPSRPSCIHGRLLKPRLRVPAAMSETHSCADHVRSAVESGPSRIMQAKATKNPAPHILNAVTVFGIRYAHLIVSASGASSRTRISASVPS